MIATLRDANGNALTDRIVTWTSSAPTIASGSFVNAFATIAGVAQGIATINATSEGVTGSATVSVVATSGGGIQLTCAGVAGGRIYGNDGVYLGRLTNQFDAESILNQFGSYGGQFGTYSMYNTFGQYGSAFSALSAFNTLTATPPLLFVNGNFAAFVTKNTIKVPRVDPAALRTCNF
ncbi:MAG: hypothetical protein JWO05_1061 [Gemmatimonadetes bacterium]|nr:hypothetical protein [Gemmatimonadota bacterium]